MYGCTLAYTAPELCLQFANAPSFSSDIYSWAMTCYEIFSEFSTPWMNVTPISSHAILLRIIESGKRPLVTILEANYPKQSDLIAK